MSLLRKTIFLFSLTSTLGSPGTQLAQTIRNIFANSPETLDLCILNDSPSWSWPDLLDDFIPGISPIFAVTRLDWIGFADGTNCNLHLIFLSSAITSPVSFSQMANSFLVADDWNRFGKFVFVGVDDGSFSVKLFDVYSALAKTLGITQSVIYFLAKNGGLLLQYDYFKGKLNVFREVEIIGGIFRENFFRDMYGFDFHALFIRNKPYAFIGKDNDVAGLHVRIIFEFCRHVNATLRARVPKKEFPNQSQFAQLLQAGFISLVNGVTMVPKFTELAVTGSQSGLCFLIPERIIGSMHLHLLRPYSFSLFILISCGLILLPIISIIFPGQFPHGIFNQLFHGSIIDEYKMARIERFTLFALAVVLFLLCEAYLAKLFQLLFNYQYEPHLESIDELLSTNYRVYCDQPVHQLHVESVYPQFKSRIQIIYAIEFYNNPDPDIALLTYCDFAKSAILAKENLNQTSNYLRYYVLAERIPLLTNAFTHSRLQPFSERFNEIYTELLEAGLFDYWYAWDAFEWTLKGVSTLELVQFGHLFSLWKLLVTCYGISCVVFVGEVIINWVLGKNARAKVVV